MASTTPWHVDFLAALEVRDRREKAYDDIISAYTRLADRTHTIPVAAAPPTTASPSPGTPTTSAANPPLGSPADAITISTLTLQTTSLTSANASLTTQLAASERERTRLERRCKDLVDELKSKDKVVQNTQDEMVALEMELNVALQKREEVVRDNQMLLDRWMAYKLKEAERMNEMNQAEAGGKAK
ncbi:autophagy protein 16-domain-containing protein [Geopyxis carbonaria]|nr:autophagy protein 16-domain-containing protein [Geopyxis carbonaria]